MDDLWIFECLLLIGFVIGIVMLSLCSAIYYYCCYRSKSRADMKNGENGCQSPHHHHHQYQENYHQQHQELHHHQPVVDHDYLHQQYQEYLTAHRYAMMDANTVVNQHDFPAVVVDRNVMDYDLESPPPPYYISSRMVDDLPPPYSMAIIDEPIEPASSPSQSVTNQVS